MDGDERLRRAAVLRAIVERDAAGLVALLADLDAEQAGVMLDECTRMVDALALRCAPRWVDYAEGRRLTREVLGRVQHRAVLEHLRAP